MTITRRTIADEIDRLDAEISELQMNKATVFAAYRDQLEEAGNTKPEMRAEIAVIKSAIRRRRELVANPEAVEDRETLFDEIVAEILGGTKNAPRVRTRASDEPMPAGLKIESEAPGARRSS